MNSLRPARVSSSSSATRAGERKCDFRETAEAARSLRQRNPSAKIEITKLRNGARIPSDRFAAVDRARDFNT
jgi:hypothetical protein